MISEKKFTQAESGSVLRELLDRFVESPLMLVSDSDLRDELPAAIAKTPIVDTVTTAKAGIEGPRVGRLW